MEEVAGKCGRTPDPQLGAVLRIAYPEHLLIRSRSGAVTAVGVRQRAHLISRRKHGLIGPVVGASGIQINLLPAAFLPHLQNAGRGIEGPGKPGPESHGIDHHHKEQGQQRRCHQVENLLPFRPEHEIDAGSHHNQIEHQDRRIELHIRKAAGISGAHQVLHSRKINGIADLRIRLQPV